MSRHFWCKKEKHNLCLSFSWSPAKLNSPVGIINLYPIFAVAIIPWPVGWYLAVRFGGKNTICTYDGRPALVFRYTCDKQLSRIHMQCCSPCFILNYFRKLTRTTSWLRISSCWFVVITDFGSSYEYMRQIFIPLPLFCPCLLCAWLHGLSVVQ